MHIQLRLLEIDKQEKKLIKDEIERKKAIADKEDLTFQVTKLHRDIYLKGLAVYMYERMQEKLQKIEEAEIAA